MVSFEWKRKICEKVSKATSQQFKAEAGDDKDLVDDDNVNWVRATKKKGNSLRRLCKEKYWEAIHKWDEALQLTPEDATFH